VPLARRDRDVDGPTFGVDDDVKFGRKTPARTAEGIELDPPFPPDASWCARTMEPSTIEPTSSTSNWSALKISSQWPFFAQFANRL